MRQFCEPGEVPSNYDLRTFFGALFDTVKRKSSNVKVVTKMEICKMVNFFMNQKMMTLDDMNLSYDGFKIFKMLTGSLNCHKLSSFCGTARTFFGIMTRKESLMKPDRFCPHPTGNVLDQ